jgi:hypothetical protein
MLTTIRPPVGVKLRICPLSVADADAEGDGDDTVDVEGGATRSVPPDGDDPDERGDETGELMAVGSGGTGGGAVVELTATTRARGCSNEASRNTRCTPNQDTDTAAAVAPAQAVPRMSPLRTGISMT